MDTTREKLCRLCLKIIHNNDCKPAENLRSMLDIVIFKPLNLDANSSKCSVICNSCVENLQTAFEFKSTCLYTEDCINSHLPNLKDDIKLDLKVVYLNLKNNSNVNIVNLEEKICRLCLTLLASKAYIFLNETKENVMVKDALEKCIPELNLSISEDPVACESCFNVLHIYSEFVARFLDVERKFQSGFEAVQSNMIEQSTLNDALYHKLKRTECNESGNTDIGTTICAEVKNEVKDFEFDIKTEKVEIKSEITESESESYQDHSSNILEQRSTYDSNCSADLKVVHCNNCKCQTTHRPIKQPSEVEVYQCTNCGFGSKLNSCLNSQKNQSKVTMHKCDICDYKSKRRFCLKQHMLSHKDASEVTTYKCETCPYETKYKYDIMKHQIVHKDPSEVKMYKCDTCPFETKYKKHLKRHTLTHKPPSEVTVYQCEQCSYKTKHKECINRHVLSHRNKERRQQMRLNNPRRFTCEICSFTTKRKDNLRQHELIHKNSNETTIYKCTMCSFHTKYKENLNRHTLRHEGTVEITVYKCETCSYSTKCERYFTSHLSVHEHPSELPVYKCGICPYVSKYKGSLKRHISTHKA